MTSKTNIPCKNCGTIKANHPFKTYNTKENIWITCNVYEGVREMTEQTQSSIDQKRKELEDNIKYSTNYEWSIATTRLEDFNLGVEMARKEFLEWLQLLSHGRISDDIVHNKIRELMKYSPQVSMEKSADMSLADINNKQGSDGGKE